MTKPVLDLFHWGVAFVSELRERTPKIVRRDQ